uniref:Secreted protein n=1 Tax=Plectus sambesii TaxID=2011161 RepID=A0A914WSR7_9BILA
MFHFLLLVCATVIANRSVTAYLHPCAHRWLTTDINGLFLNDTRLASSAVDGVICNPKVANSCTGGPNAVCMFSTRTWSYRCCHDVWKLGDSGIGEFAYNKTGAGFAKPLCPYGATGLPFALPCNISNQANQGCPYGYSCTKAGNLPKNATLYPGEASNSPYVCCLTKTLLANMDKC